MKVFMNKKQIIFLVAIVFSLLSACSKSDDMYNYQDNTSVDTSSSRTENDDTVTVDDFDVVLSFNSNAKTLNFAQKRTIADFFFYNKGVGTKKNAQWGVVNVEEIFKDSPSIYNQSSLERAYWNFDGLFNAYSVLDYDDFTSPLFSPGPKDIGTLRNINIQFAFDLDEERGVIESDRAMLVMEVETTEQVFYAKFNYSMISLRTSGDNVYVTFADNCGKIFFYGKLNAQNQTMSSVKITYVNSRSSYTDGKCYFEGSLPKYIHEVARIPYDLANGLERDENSQGHLFKGINIYLKELN